MLWFRSDLQVFSYYILERKFCCDKFNILFSITYLSTGCKLSHLILRYLCKRHLGEQSRKRYYLNISYLSVSHSFNSHRNSVKNISSKLHRWKGLTCRIHIVWGHSWQNAEQALKPFMSTLLSTTQSPMGAFLVGNVLEEPIYINCILHSKLGRILSTSWMWVFLTGFSGD